MKDKKETQPSSWKDIARKPERDEKRQPVEKIDEELSDAIPIQTPYFEDFVQVDNETTLKEE